MPSSPLRPLSVGEILDLAFALYRRHIGTLMGIALVCSGLPLVLSVFLQTGGGLLAHPLLSLGYYAVVVVLHSVAIAATTFVVSESYLGRDITVRASLSRSRPYIGRLVVYSLLFTLIVVAGMVLLVVPGVILACGLALTAPVLVLEASPSATAALGRSWALTRGWRLRIFAIGVVIGLLLYIPIIALGVVAAIMLPGSAVGLTAGTPSLGFVLLTVVGAGLAQLFIYPLLYCVLTITYYDLRVRKEGFDLEVLAQTLQVA